MKKKTQVIIAAGGSGVRMQETTPKPFLTLCGQPLLAHSLRVFAACPGIDGIIVAARADQVDACRQLAEASRIVKPLCVVPGGVSRRDSVACGLAALDEDTAYVLIHDAARPLVTPVLVADLLRICYDEQAVIPAVPVKATIKQVDPATQQVTATLDRTALWEVQTPQAFARELIVRAHDQDPSLPATDDASLVEQLGRPVRVVMGDYRNIKITTPEDLRIAAALLA